MSDIAKELATRLNARACFDLIYQQAATRLRDDSALRKRMVKGHQLSDTVAARARERELEMQAFIEKDKAMRVIPWADISTKWTSSQEKEFLKSIGIPSLSSLPTIPTGSRITGGRLVTEITKRHPQQLRLADNISANIDRLSQCNRYSHLLLGGIYSVKVELERALLEIRKKFNWGNGPIVFVPPSLFTGYIHIKISKEELANGEYAALPPIESVMILSAPETGVDYYWKEVMVVWFGMEYGIPEQVIAHLKNVDWNSVGVPSGW